MGFDSTIRLRQLNQSELSGFCSQVTSGVLSSSGTAIAATGKLTSAFYPLNQNPAGYAKSGDYLAQIDLDSAMAQENAYIASTYYLKTNPSGYLSSSNALVLTGNQTASGIKNFADGILISGLPISLGNVVSLTGNQVISGNKTFMGNVGISGNTTISGNVSLSGNIAITGTGTINGSPIIISSGYQVISGLKNFTGALIVSGAETNTVYNKTLISGGAITIPCWDASTPSNQNYTPRLSFTNSGTELGIIQCWGDHAGANRPELQIISQESLGIILGYNGRTGEAFCQMGTSDSTHETFYFQYDALPYNVYNDGLTANPFGHSKRVGFVALASGGGETRYACPGLMGVTTTSNKASVYGTNYTIPGELWFYSMIPEYPYTSFSGIRMGRMMISGWDLRGTQIRENQISSGSNFTVNFSGAPSQTYSVTSSTVTITGSGQSLSPNDSQQISVLIKSGPYTSVSMTFPPWSWGSPTGVASAPTGINEQQGLLLNLKTFGTGVADVFATYSIHSVPYGFDSGAYSFITAANITNGTQRVAVDTLTKNAKAHNWWNLCDAIYPFVGGTSGSHSWNLKNTGQYRISWPVNPTHSFIGVSGGGGSYGDTNYMMSGAPNWSLTGCHLFAYHGTSGVLAPGGNNYALLAGYTWPTPTSRAGLIFTSTLAIAALGTNNSVSTSGPINESGVLNGYSGAAIVTRTGLNAQSVGMRTDWVAGDSTTADFMPNAKVGILARIDQANSIDYIYSGVIKGASMGGGVDFNTWNQMRADWDTYQLMLGR